MTATARVGAVGPDLTDLEIVKFADELGTERFDYLAGCSADQVRRLRRVVSDARVERHRHRFVKLAALTKIAPTPMVAKIAEGAVGAELSARIAGAMDSAAALRLTRALSLDFLAQVSAVLDPASAEDIISALDTEVLLEVAGRLLADQRYIPLARFVTIVDVEVAVAVAERATGADLIDIALYAEDHDVLDEVVRRLPDEKLGEIAAAIGDQGRFAEAITMLGLLEDDNRARMLTHHRAAPAAARKALERAAAAVGAEGLLV